MHAAASPALAGRGAPRIHAATTSTASARSMGTLRAPCTRRRIRVAAREHDADQKPAVDSPERDEGGSVSESRRVPSASGRGIMRPEEATDFMSATLTRRFGLKGGLAWLGLLTFGVVAEQVKTRLEVASDEQNTVAVQGATEVRLPSGVTYVDLVRGGGAPMQPGFLAVVNFTATADGEVFEDTRARGKPIVFVYGARPITGGLCRGTEEAMASMRAGGRRRITVPPEMGFGQDGFAVRGTRHAGDKGGVVPPNATLVYDLTLERVSIPPS